MSLETTASSTEYLLSGSLSTLPMSQSRHTTTRHKALDSFVGMGCRSQHQGFAAGFALLFQMLREAVSLCSPTMKPLRFNSLTTISAKAYSKKRAKIAGHRTAGGKGGILEKAGRKGDGCGNEKESQVYFYRSFPPFRQKNIFQKISEFFRFDHKKIWEFNEN